MNLEKEMNFISEQLEFIELKIDSQERFLKMTISTPLIKEIKEDIAKLENDKVLLSNILNVLTDVALNNLH